MALRFQDKCEEVDEAVKQDRRFSLFFFLFLFAVMAAVFGAWYCLSGRTLHAYEQDAGWAFLCLMAIWLTSCAHSEFRIRMNATYGAVSAIQGRLDVLDKELLPVKAEPRTLRRPSRLPLPD